MGLNFSELMVILVIILILFGPGKLPEIGKALGRGIREFKRAQREVSDGLDGDPNDTSANKNGAQPENKSENHLPVK